MLTNRKLSILKYHIFQKLTLRMPDKISFQYLIVFKNIN
jgi:hypothetical protein